MRKYFCKEHDKCSHFSLLYGDILQGFLVKTAVVNKHFYEIDLVEQSFFNTPLPSGSVFRTQSNICDGAFLQPKAVNHFHKKAPLCKFDWVLNTRMHSKRLPPKQFSEGVFL